MAEVMTLDWVEKKLRDPGDAYCVIANGSWDWEVLGRYAKDDTKQYARWFCNVHGVAEEMGDVYVSDIVAISSQLVSVDGREPTEDELEVFTELKESMSKRTGGISVF